MSARPRVRTFRRDDRDQLTDLVNSHLSAVVPGARLSVNSVLGSLERQPDEHVVEPWVVERATFVVESRHRVVGAAHLHRFTAGPEASDDYRTPASCSGSSSRRPTTRTRSSPPRPARPRTR